MRLSNLIFSICVFAMFSKGAVAQEVTESPLALLPAKMKCKAHYADDSSLAGDVQVLITETQGYQVEIQALAKTSPLLNFKLGRGYAAGIDHSEAEVKNCRFYNSKTQGGEFSLIYYCSDEPLPERPTYLDARKAFLKSTYYFNPHNLTNGRHRVCKHTQMGGCFDLSACSAIK